MGERCSILSTTTSRPTSMSRGTGTIERGRRGRQLRGVDGRPRRPDSREQPLRLGDRRATVTRTGSSTSADSRGVVGMTNVYVDRMAPAFSEGKYRFGKHPTLLEEFRTGRPRGRRDVVVAVTEIGLPWMVQAAKDCASVDVMFSAHPRVHLRSDRRRGDRNRGRRVRDG